MVLVAYILAELCTAGLKTFSYCFSCTSLDDVLMRLFDLSISTNIVFKASLAHCEENHQKCLAGPLKLQKIAIEGK